MYPQSGRGWLLVGRGQFGAKPQHIPRQEVSIVQAAWPKTGLLEGGILPNLPLEFAFRGASSIRASYPKRYRRQSEGIVSGANTNGDRSQLSEFAPTIPAQHFWQLDRSQPCNSPPAEGPTTVATPRVTAGALRRLRFSRRHCLSTVLEEIHDEQTRGAHVSTKTLEHDRKGRTCYGDVAE